MKVIPPNMPSGVIMPFAGTVVPAGWLLCDGTTYSRSLYPALFAAIGTVWGSGDGSTTFHSPDMRGRFLRGRDNSAGRDTDRATRTASNTGGATGDNIGSVQAGANAIHAHTQIANYYNVASPLNENYGTGSSRVRNGWAGVGSLVDVSTNSSINNSGSEARPQNANVNYIIKI